MKSAISNTLKRKDENLMYMFQHQMFTRYDLADILEIDIDTLYYYSYRKDHRYRQFTIPKKNGELRVIKAPVKGLKSIQRRISYILSLFYTPETRTSAHGFIKGKSIVTNAEKHVNKKYILNIDLKDFFPSINFGRVRGLFITHFNMGKDAATYLAQLCCDSNELPIGAPASPVISNLICRRLDKELSIFAKKNNACYSRYADDITFSSNIRLNSNMYDFTNNKLGTELISIIEGNGFVINDDKTRIQHCSTHQEVTGIVVNERINLSKKYIKNLRAQLHQSQFDEDKYVYELQIIGKLNYLKMVRGSKDKLFLKYAYLYETIYNNNLFNAKRDLSPLEWISERCFVIDPLDNNEQELSNGTGFMLADYGLVTARHVLSEIKNDEIYNYTYQSIQTADLILPSKEKKKIPLYNTYLNDQTDVAVITSYHNMTAFEPEFKFDYCKGQKLIVVGFPNYN